MKKAAGKIVDMTAPDALAPNIDASKIINDVDTALVKTNNTTTSTASGKVVSQNATISVVSPETASYTLPVGLPKPRIVIPPKIPTSTSLPTTTNNP